ncbi:ATP-binding cassette domain-containing protein [Paracoccus limosus]|jgi:iron complex transport system ATP-binding protein|uniref:ATP-binding cassette domain-containing protein n=1 Tax=Paracoccus limosus TaxID=913252 RepID=A0A844H414_9RHOB|nr:ABC transporter ATP-binding protein [Paracoccus limosus]MTH34294.1 ATP-binding cassette domain-containing protein [Paracoccus limosus]
MTPLLATRGLAVGHGGRALIAGLELRLPPGQVLCVLGPNGAGKTTLFRTLLGLIPPVAGEVLLAGAPLAQLSRRRIAARLAHVPQALANPFAFAALDIVLMGAAARLGPLARPGPPETARAMAALQRLGIADLAQARIGQLSGGQRQLVLIARALAQQAAALIMDEPTASLDFANRRRVGQAIRDLAGAGHGIILSSHDPDHAAALADQVLLMGRHGVIASGTVDGTMTAANLSQLYGIAVSRQQDAGGALHFR